MSQTKAQLLDGKSATIQFTGGSASAPSVSFTGDTNTGIYSPGADQVAISTGGTRRLIIFSDGKVGLGAASVLQQGSGVDGGSGAGILELYNGGTGNTTLENTGAFPILFKTSGTERLRITSAGLVGVGTSTPASLLTSYAGNVSALGAKASTGLLIENNGSVGNISQIGLGYTFSSINHPTAIAAVTTSGASSTRADLVFATRDLTTDVAPTERMRIDSSGRVGIGTTSPGYALHVSGTGAVSSRTFATDATGDASFFVQNDGNGICGPLVYGSTKTAYGALASNETAFYSNRSTTIMADGGGAVIKFATGGNTERARIDSSGRLLVGTSSSSAEAKFIVQGGATAAGGAINIQRNATTASAGSTIGFINFANSANNVGATISADGDGTWSAGTSHPTRLAFSTTADGASSPTERARLNNLGYLTGTVNGLGNGLYLANQFYRLNSGNVGSNATGAQSVFGAGVNLVADTVYAFESFYVLQKSAGTTSHTVAVSFGGTAGLNNINYGIIWNRDNTAAASSNMTGIAGAYQSFATAASSLVLTSAIASANQTITLKLSGTVSISTAGTFVPQYTLSAAPGGAYTTLAGSYFKIAALGAAGSNISIGSWA